MPERAPRPLTPYPNSGAKNSVMLGLFILGGIMLIKIDLTRQAINTKKIESIRVEPPGTTYKIRMFSGDIFYVKSDIIDKIFEGVV